MAGIRAWSDSNVARFGAWVRVCEGFVIYKAN